VLVGCDATICQRLDAQQRQRIQKQLLPVVIESPQQFQRFTCGRPASQLTAEQFELAVVSVANLYPLPQMLCSVCVPQGDCRQAAASLMASPPDAAPWCSAASSMLQCVGLLQQMQSGVPQSAGQNQDTAMLQQLFSNIQQSEAQPGWPSVALMLARGAVTTVQAATVVAGPATTPAPEASDSKVYAATWQLHSRLAQLVHCSAGSDSPIVHLEGAQQLVLLSLLSDCLTAAAVLRRTLWPPLVSPCQTDR